jgi:hypothetical protein
MSRTFRLSAVYAALLAVTVVTPAMAKWPPWLSIESPVNPFDASTRGTVFLVHAATHDGTPELSALSGSAEGLVAGSRRTIALTLTATSHPGVFAVRKQWPSEGTWLVRITLASTTALVSLDAKDNVANVYVPTTIAEGRQIPRAVVAREIDSTLEVASAR